MIPSRYRAQVELLLRVVPFVALEETLALKGGTAINLFARNMPRLSVDLDLTYLPFDRREDALRNIADALSRVKNRVENSISGVKATINPRTGGADARLICRSRKATVKVEVNTIMRGHLWPPRELPVAQAVEHEFQMSAVIAVVSHAELFGGKICAALDRQHPRDLFDVHQLQVNEGIDETVRLGFLASLLSHPRPMHEIIYPRRQDQRKAFDTLFAGMARTSFDYDEYVSTRETLIHEIRTGLASNERTFLLTFKQGNPEWSLLPLTDLRNLPAVQWKLDNIRNLKRNRRKHAAQVKALEDALFGET